MKKGKSADAVAPEQEIQLLRVIFSTKPQLWLYVCLFSGGLTIAPDSEACFSFCSHLASAPNGGLFQNQELVSDQSCWDLFMRLKSNLSPSLYSCLSLRCCRLKVLVAAGNSLTVFDTSLLPQDVLFICCCCRRTRCGVKPAQKK